MNSNGTNGNTGNTGNGTGTPSTLVARARALVAGRHERNSGLKKPKPSSHHHQKPPVTSNVMEEGNPGSDEKNCDISPVREAQNPFLAII